MARPLRIEYEGAVYHVTSRGNKRNSIYDDDTDRLTFLDILHKVNKRYNFLCHAYCLMSNHYHLLIETPDGNLSKGMRQLNGVYSLGFNKRHKTAGHVLQGRYKAILIQRESHLLEGCRYVVLNPVRAKIVNRPEQWKWSSYLATAGFEKSHLCFGREWILGQFAERKKTAEGKYREFVEAGIGKDTIWRDVKGQSLLGKDDFIEGLIGYVRGYEEVQEIPKSQRYINRPELSTLFSGKTLLDKRTRNDMMVEAINKHGYSQKEIADHLEMHYTSVSRAVSKTLKVKT
jgi:putative transposase